ncbi:MAG TPA: hypothetical protein VIM42_07975 [Clostridium sp.]
MITNSFSIDNILVYLLLGSPILSQFIIYSSMGFGVDADAASAEEVIIAHKAGLSYEKILYSSPGKTRKNIEETLNKSIIVADMGTADIRVKIGHMLVYISNMWLCIVL